ncbi:MAG: fumarate hydratase [Candidatus Omnitrophica bacterium]|nr:fumarate hydratase [Candidatus Omnitrophota bacterium]
MRTITAATIKSTVAQLCKEANLVLPHDVLLALRRAAASETDRRAKGILRATIDNALIAHKQHLAICQDTGMACVFVKLGQDVRVLGNLSRAINQGVAQGYKEACLRNSIIKDPLMRATPAFQPAIIHTELVQGNKMSITVLPKGFGCENKTRLVMLNPTASWDKVKDFIIDTVKAAGPDACPPYIIGVGIGGTAEHACLLAKKALLKNINSRYSQLNAKLVRLQNNLLKQINGLNIGPMGLGGKTTALAVNIETYPTHIAGLPVCVNISCHALRRATKVL